jgi:hypothetical protein
MSEWAFGRADYSRLQVDTRIAKDTVEAATLGLSRELILFVKAV